MNTRRFTSLRLVRLFWAALRATRPAGRISFGHRFFALAGPLALAVSLLGAAGCRQTPALAAGADTAPPPMPVATALVLQSDLRDWDEYTGRLEAIQTVQVRARVSGALDKIAFKDGQIVKQGTLLFIIDPRPYEATRDRAAAALQQAEARLTFAQSNLSRGESLLTDNAIATEDVEQRRTDARQAESGVAAARAALREAELNVEFTHIVAPVTGRIDRHYVSEGNLVSGGSAEATLLTTIVSLDPIYAYFETDERAYLKYSREKQPNGQSAARGGAAPVELALADESGFPHKGTMDFLENRMDTETATIRARALVPNPDLTLTPGLFARVRLQGGERYSAILVPEAAIGSDQSQKFVYIVNAKSEIEYRAVTLGPRVDGLQVIRTGLSPADRIVLSGLQVVRPGIKVTPKDEPVQRAAAAENVPVGKGRS
jgi:RND family efflux transporter MFP subunit